jgi:Zn-dependent protease
MPSSPIAGGFRLFKLFGITVYLHFTWFLVAAYEIQTRRGDYSSVMWNVAEYVTLFAIVLTHEFGHALACRSVGGQANQIILWPLGGIAFVNPPPRPGALLWSIAAGPLVNVLLLPVTLPFLNLPLDTDLHRYLHTIAYINAGLLIFNILPIYPLDGGQIVQALLWFVMGRGRSLMVATVIGMLGALGIGTLAILSQNYWFIVLAIFAGYQAWRGFTVARIMRHNESLPRRAGLKCPNCRTAPPVGTFWYCSNCRHPFDIFERSGICPNCGTAHRVAACPSCRKVSPLSAWMGLAPTAPPPPPMPLSPLPPRSPFSSAPPPPPHL